MLYTTSLAAAVVWVLLGPLGGWIAAQKNRSPLEGLILGWLFGPLGVIVEALLPTLHGYAEDVPEAKLPPEPAPPVERIREAPARVRETPPAIDRLNLN